MTRILAAVLALMLSACTAENRACHDGVCISVLQNGNALRFSALVDEKSTRTTHRRYAFVRGKDGTPYGVVVGNNRVGEIHVCVAVDGLNVGTNMPIETNVSNGESWGTCEPVGPGSRITLAAWKDWPHAYPLTFAALRSKIHIPWHQVSVQSDGTILVAIFTMQPGAATLTRDADTIFLFRRRTTIF